MNTKELVQLTQSTLTKAMMIRSAPSGGLPIAFRSILLELGSKTILADNPYETFPATQIVGGVTSNYYVTGDAPLESDIASMSNEPFPLITPYMKVDVNSQDSSMDFINSFKNSITGNSLQLRYMMVQFSRLGFEYMRNMKYFPKTMNMNNNKEIAMNIKSHVPAELFRTTMFRTQGKGSNTYPMNPAEIFYTMYELLERGYDLPVEKLSAFRGFDLGNRNVTVYMKPEALYSLFDIGICSFASKIDYDLDYGNSKIIIKSFPYDIYGKVYYNQVESLLVKNNYVFNTFRVDPTGVSIHGDENFAIEIKIQNFFTRDENMIRADIEANFFKNLYSTHYHFAHEVDVEVENKNEVGFSLKSRSVRDTLVRCIENFKEVTAHKYQVQIDELEEKIKVLRIYEKATRPYIAQKIRELLLENDSVRVNELKRFTDEFHQQNPDEYPEFTTEEISNYIWVSKGNDVIANLNRRGHDYYRSQIESELRAIDGLKEKMNAKSIIEEAKQTYLKLSQLNEFKRKSPVKFLNGSISLDAKEKLLDYVSIFEKGKINSKIHYYGGSTVLKTSGENLPAQYQPSYTIRDKRNLLYQEGRYLRKLLPNLVPYMDNKLGYIAGDIKLLIPEDEVGIYLTNFGRVGITDIMYPRDYEVGYPLLEGEFFLDFIPVTGHVNTRTYMAKSKAKLLMTSNEEIKIITLEEFLEDYRLYRDLTRLAKYDSTLAIEIIEDESDLQYMYIWNRTSKKFVRLSDVNWKDLGFALGEHYYPNAIYSGNKKIYLDGIHVPVNILSKVLGIEFKKANFVEYIDLPLEFKSYIAYISANEKDNSDAEIENLKSAIEERRKNLVASELVKDNDVLSSIATCQFIREI